MSVKESMKNGWDKIRKGADRAREFLSEYQEELAEEYGAENVALAKKIRDASNPKSAFYTDLGLATWTVQTLVEKCGFERNQVEQLVESHSNDLAEIASRAVITDRSRISDGAELDPILLRKGVGELLERANKQKQEAQADQGVER
ncbi:MAG: hypothetical protein LBM01_00220 [Christensenellaceae bacterium]|jgi:hypothetical protein|nr:hypothetical protein [Christensenellaceae bacterium]